MTEKNYNFDLGRTIDTEKMVDTVLGQKSSEMITLIEEKTLPMGKNTLPMGKITLPMGEMRDSGKSAIAGTETVIFFLLVIIEKNLPNVILETSCGEKGKLRSQMTLRKELPSSLNLGHLKKSPQAC